MHCKERESAPPRFPGGRALERNRLDGAHGTVDKQIAYAWPTSKRTKSVTSIPLSSVNCFTVFLESARDGWSSSTTSL